MVLNLSNRASVFSP